MEIKQHFYISLERVPERYMAWRGCQEAWNFDFQKLIWCYATDIMNYSTKRQLYKHMVDSGLKYISKFLNDPNFGQNTMNQALLAYHASFMITFNHIAKQDPRYWYVVWEADYVLDMPYTGFRILIEREVPTDANILLMSGIHNSWQPHNKFIERQLSETHPYFYVGCPGIGGTHCIAVTPAGAADILRVDAETFPNIFDAMMVEHSEKFSGLYTLTFQPVHKTTVSGITSTAKGNAENKGEVHRKEIHAGVLDEKGTLHEDVKFFC